MIPYILNLTDLCFTLYALRHGAIEANPFMKSVPFMIVYKIVVIGALILFLESRPEHTAKVGLKVITILYAAINLWHILNLTLA